jgi:hypothetical protein
VKSAIAFNLEDRFTAHETDVLEALRRACREVDVSLSFDREGRYRLEGHRDGQLVLGVTMASLRLARRAFEEGYAKALAAQLLPKRAPRRDDDAALAQRARRREYLMETGRIDELTREGLEHP